MQQARIEQARPRLGGGAAGMIGHGVYVIGDFRSTNSDLSIFNAEIPQRIGLCLVWVVSSPRKIGGFGGFSEIADWLRKIGGLMAGCGGRFGGSAVWRRLDRNRRQRMIGNAG